MNDIQATINVVKERLNRQLLEEFENSNLPIDCSEKYDELPHLIIFANQKYSKKSKKQPIHCSFSSELILEVELNPLVNEEVWLRMAILNDDQCVKLGKIRNFSRQIFSISKNFCKQFNLPLVMVPFELAVSDITDEVVITLLPKFEYLRFADSKDRSKYKNLDDFYISEANSLNECVELLKSFGKIREK